MAGELELKKFVNDTVRPLVNKIVPEIMARLNEIEEKLNAGSGTDIDVHSVSVIGKEQGESEVFASKKDDALKAYEPKTKKAKKAKE